MLALVLVPLCGSTDRWPASPANFLFLAFSSQLACSSTLQHLNLPGPQDEEVLTDACWALSYLSDGTNDKIQEVINSGVCRRLVELLL